MGFFTPDTKLDALKQIERINSEMRAINALIHLNYNMIDGRNRNKIIPHLRNAMSYAQKYDKIKANLSGVDRTILLGENVDVWNGERVNVFTWETYFRNVTNRLTQDLNY